MLESLQLNGPVMGGVSALTRVLKVPCAVGKSMLIHRDDLEAIGGFRFLGQFLAEDQICAEELARRGRPVVVTGHLIDNVLGRRTLREFVGRHCDGRGSAVTSAWPDTSARFSSTRSSWPSSACWPSARRLRLSWPVWP